MMPNDGGGCDDYDAADDSNIESERLLSINFKGKKIVNKAIQRLTLTFDN